ncbi:hypothetical protein HDU96_002911 [Phlyctochytrium bullatum]|nr:hypothetical protein HDU96_002911 [Phlyctochytrium bullatum]
MSSYPMQQINNNNNTQRYEQPPPSESTETIDPPDSGNPSGANSPRGIKKFGKDLERGVKQTGQAVGSVAQDFFNFLKRGNVIDLAVGVIMGAAFTAIVNSLVNDLITPVIGLATEKNLENTFVVIRCGRNDTPTGRVKIDPLCQEGKQYPYPTVASAAAAGALTVNWGRFIQIVFNFLVISAFVYFMVKIYSATFLRVVKQPVKTKPCQFCLEDIKPKATRCKWCTAEQLPEPSTTPVPGPSTTPIPFGNVISNIKNTFVPARQEERKKV